MSTSAPLPVVTGEQMAAVDKAMVAVCGLELMQVMETAGRAVAVIARRRWHRAGATGHIAILCGSGGNGGDGFVCGRYLASWGIPVELWLMRSSSELRGLTAHQLTVCRKIGMTIVEPELPADFGNASLLVDGLFGFGLSAPPSGRAAALIQAANASPAPILAIDIPSGIEATAGNALGPVIRAECTVTLGLPKQGLLQKVGERCAGTVVVADIGIPAAAYRAAGIPLTAAFQTTAYCDLAGEPILLDSI